MDKINTPEELEQWVNLMIHHPAHPKLVDELQLIKLLQKNLVSRATILSDLREVAKLRVSEHDFMEAEAEYYNNKIDDTPDEVIWRAAFKDQDDSDQNQEIHTKIQLSLEFCNLIIKNYEQTR